MNNIRGHIIKHIFLVAIVCVFLSCSSDLNNPVVTSDDVELQIGFRLATRTTGDDLYEEGEMYENYIDVAGGGYRILFFDTDNKFIARFYPNGVISNEGKNYREYDVTGTVPSSLVSHNDFKVVVIANWPTYLEESEMTVGKTTINDLCNNVKSQFEQFTSFSLGANRLIPFYGVREFTDVTFEPDVATILTDPITLLRAVSKVEVILKSKTEDDLSLKSVQICRYNQKGYCAPSADQRSDYDHDGVWEDDYAESLHLVNGKNDVDSDGNAEDKSLSFLKVKSWESDGYKHEKWIAYLTEYQNVDAEDGYCYVEAKFTNQLEDDASHKIYFAKYENGQTDNEATTRLNIERNNLYRFNVTATPLQLHVSVDEWVYGGTVHIEM